MSYFAYVPSQTPTLVRHCLNKSKRQGYDVFIGKFLSILSPFMSYCHSSRRQESVFQPALMFPVALHQAGLPHLGGCVSSSCRDFSAKVSVDVQQARQNATDCPDQPLIFSHWKFCLYLFAASNRSKPLLPIVSALMHKKRVPEGVSGYSSSQSPPKRDEGSFGPLDLFRIAGTVVLPQTICHIQFHGENMPVLKQEIWLSATNSVKIASRVAGDGADAGTQTQPPPISLNWSSYRSSDRNEVRIPFMWQDLQFQMPPDHSDSCRSGLAKRFFVQLQVVATLFGGYRVIIAQVNAGPMLFEDTGAYKLHCKKDVSRSGSALLHQADWDISPNTRRAVSSPKLYGLGGVTLTVRNSKPPKTSCTARQRAHRAATSVRGLRLHPYLSIVPAHIRQRSRCARLPASHPLRTTRLPISC